MPFYIRIYIYIYKGKQNNNEKWLSCTSALLAPLLCDLTLNQIGLLATLACCQPPRGHWQLFKAKLMLLHCRSGQPCSNWGTTDLNRHQLQVFSEIKYEGVISMIPFFCIISFWNHVLLAPQGNFTLVVSLINCIIRNIRFCTFSICLRALELKDKKC